MEFKGLGFKGLRFRGPLEKLSKNCGRVLDGLHKTFRRFSLAFVGLQTCAYVSAVSGLAPCIWRCGPWVAP